MIVPLYLENYVNAIVPSDTKVVFVVMLMIVRHMFVRLMVRRCSFFLSFYILINMGV